MILDTDPPRHNTSIGTGEGLLPATHQVPVADSVGTLYWADSDARWHLTAVVGIRVTAECGASFPHGMHFVTRDIHPPTRADLPLCKRCARIDSKDRPR